MTATRTCDLMPFQPPAGLPPKSDDPPPRVGILYGKRTQGNPITGSYSQDFGPFDGNIWLNLGWAEPMTMVAARFEEAFSWVKPVAGQRKTRFRDPLTFAAAYSLMCLPKLMVTSP